MGKSRVTPIKPVTLPRLELIAAVTAVKLSRILRKELRYPVKEHLWTDSQIVLGYFRDEAKRFHMFVANRVHFIRERTEPEQWHYVESENNPADHTSRGLNVSQLISSNWFVGPSFLWESQLDWMEPTIDLDLADPEIRTNCATNTVAKEDYTLLKRLEHFSDWHRAVVAITEIEKTCEEI
jgi:hypothetical protein